MTKKYAKYSVERRARLSPDGQEADISCMERGILAPTTSTLMRLVEALDGRLIIELKPTNKKWPVGQPVVSAVISRSH